jgi:CHASE3 domain sensor protein
MLPISQPIASLRTRIPKLLSSLRDLVADNPLQQKRIADLRFHIEARLQELARVVQLGPQRFTDALEILKSARATQLTTRIIQELSQLRQTELSLLDTRQGDAGRSALFATLSATALFIFRAHQRGIRRIHF